MRNHLCRVVLLILFAPAVRPASAAATDYSDIIIFGDSLSDVGNTANHPLAQFAQVLGDSSFDSVVNGRFSNGPVWVETLAGQLGLTGSASARSDNGGDNYAHGGARTGSGTQFFGVIDNIGKQISDYTSGHNPTGGELFVVWGGGNDLLDAVNTPAQIASNMTSHVTALANDGAQHFLVLNLPLLGEVPRNHGTAKQATLNAQSTDTNNRLDTAMAGLGPSLGLDITVFDVEATFDRLLSDPAAFGFTNTTDAAYDTSSDTAVPNPEQYVFWDEIHPTAAAHAILGRAVFIALHDEGDFTGDGQVDADDLQHVLSRYGDSTAPFDLAAGDWDGDGAVGINELDRVLDNWPQPAEQAATVPEPGTTCIFCLAGLYSIWMRRSYML